MKKYTLLVCWIVVLFLPISLARNFVIVTPSVLQVGVDHTVIVSLYGVQGQSVSVTVSIELGVGKTIFTGQPVTVPHPYGGASEVKIMVPELEIAKLTPIPQHVYVRAQANQQGITFNKRRKVVLSLKSLSVFLQTDKPIYTRNDDVNIRIVVVNSHLVPQTTAEVKVDVIDSRNVTIDRIDIQPSTERHITRKRIQLGVRPAVGEWSLLARYGVQKSTSTVFHFEVKDYVLPRFDVKITPPDYVTPDQSDIDIIITAKYTYGRGVIGFADVKVGVWEDSGEVTAFFDNTFALSSGEKGVKSVTVPSSTLKFFPLNKKLWIYASVLERASGVRYTRTDLTTAFTHSRYVIEFDSSKPFYKPGLPLSGLVKVTYTSGNPVSDLRLELKDQSDNSVSAQTNDEGIAEFTFNTDSNSAEMKISVIPYGDKVRTIFVYYPFETLCSSSSSQLYLKSRSAGTLQPGHSVFEILLHPFPTQPIDVTVLVLASGGLQFHTHLTIEKSLQSLTLFINPKWSHKFHILAYYYDASCDSIVADVLTVNVNYNFANEISLEPLSNSLSPGSDVNIRIRTKPNSDVALLAVDSGLYALNNKNKLTRKQVFEQLEEYDTSCSVEELTSEGLFNAFGLTVISNVLFFSTTPRSDVGCPEIPSRQKRSIYEDNTSCCNNFGAKVRHEYEKLTDSRINVSMEDFCSESFKQLRQGAKALNSISFTCELTQDCLEKFQDSCLKNTRARTVGLHTNKRFQGQIVADHRSYFPHVWLVDEVISSGSTGVIIKTVTLPDSITDWILHGLSLSAVGFGVAKTARLRTYKPVFIECKIPFSVRRLEQITITCMAYNFGNSDTWARVDLINIQKSICTKAGLGVNTLFEEIYLTANDAQRVLFAIVPLEIGTHKLSVRLRTANYLADEVDHQLVVEPEGIRIDHFFSAELDPQDLHSSTGLSCGREIPSERQPCYQDCDCTKKVLEKSTKTECCNLRNLGLNTNWGGNCEPCPKHAEYRRRDVFSSPNGKAQENHFNLFLPEEYIPGSEQSSISVTGRYLQSISIKSARTKLLLGIPTGNPADIAFAVGIKTANLKYMASVGKNDSDEFSTLLSSTRKSLTELLTLQRTDGGFSIGTNVSSTKFTSTVLTTLTTVSEFLFVDKSVVKRSRKFLLSHQTQRCLFTGQSKAEDQVLLSAAALISLVENFGKTKFPFGHNLQVSVCCTVDALKREINSGNVVDERTTAIVYYALSLACQHGIGICTCSPALLSSIYRQVCGLAHTSGGKTYWSSSSELEDPASPAAIITTSYVLCSFVVQRKIEAARPVARWLNGARNSRGNVRSTEDGYWSQKCLAQFSALLTKRRSLSVEASTRKAKFSKTVSINDGNIDVNQQFQIPSNDLLKVTTTGSGLGFMEVLMSYNVPDVEDMKCNYPGSWTAGEKCEVDLSVECIPSENRRQIAIKVCLRHQLQKSAGRSTLEVEIPTGYEVCEVSDVENDTLCLRQLLEEQGESIGLYLYETAGRSVFFYLEEVSSSKEVCIVFKAVEKFPVKHPSPVSVKIYSDEDPALKCTEFYSVDGTKPTLDVLGCSDSSKEPICICAAGRCPVLESISNRKCNACKHHHYAFKVHLIKIIRKNSWLKLRVEILKIIKPGLHNVQVEGRILFWMREVCLLSANLTVGKYYHVMGLDNTKFVLDHTAHIERWPKFYSRPDPGCVKRKTSACIRKNCKERKGNRKKRCETNMKKICTNNAKGNCVTGFHSYIEEMQTAHVCERDDIC